MMTKELWKRDKKGAAVLGALRGIFYSQCVFPTVPDTWDCGAGRGNKPTCMAPAAEDLSGAKVS